jgi:serine/threonine protein kinase
LRGLDATQTVSFCAQIDSGYSFHLTTANDRSGESLGHFRLLAKLGHGGMGAVYRALDESLQRFVAVKVIRAADSQESGSEQQVTRLLDEAVSQARLNHPHVVTIYYVGRVGEEPFFAMELLPGPTLGRLIENGPLPYADIIHYTQQIVGALKHASELGLVHGDIKPNNLILAGERTLKLCDFGLATTEQTTSSTQLISGTLSYMAPELALGGEPSDQSDMYSLGVTLFELTFGRRPYAIVGTTLREQLSSQQGAEVSFPEKWPAEIPEAWRQLLARLLAREPAERYASYEEFEGAINELAPVGVTSAGLLNRSMALLVDLSLLGLMMLPFMLPAQFSSQIYAQIESQGFADSQLIDSFRILASRLGLLSLLTPLVPALAAWAEWKGWRTPGRYLFQLRVVDAHGLPLNRRKRVLRSLMRNVSVWFIAFSSVALALGFDLLALFLAPLDDIILVANTIPVLGSKRRALHDRLLGSHVVLDTHSNQRRADKDRDSQQ